MKHTHIFDTIIMHICGVQYDYFMHIYNESCSDQSNWHILHFKHLLFLCAGKIPKSFYYFGTCKLSAKVVLMYYRIAWTNSSYAAMFLYLLTIPVNHLPSYLLSLWVLALYPLLVWDQGLSFRISENIQYLSSYAQLILLVLADTNLKISFFSFLLRKG